MISIPPNHLAFLAANPRVSTHGSKYDDPWRQGESHERETQRRRLARLVDLDLSKAVVEHAIDTILIDECNPKEPTNA